MKAEILHLNLVSPLLYFPLEKPRPFEHPTEDGTAECADGERVYCFEIEETQRLSFEPDKDKLLGNLIFAGKAAEDLNPGGKAAKAKAKIPAENYLFAQKREILTKEEIIALAVEIQMEALWQRLEPGKKIYLRYLFEDNSWVTQLFRPCTGFPSVQDKSKD